MLVYQRVSPSWLMILGKLCNNLTVLPHWNHGLDIGNHPKMAQHFRLVNYIL